MISPPLLRTCTAEFMSRPQSVGISPGHENSFRKVPQPMSDSNSKRDVGEAIYGMAIGARVPRPDLQILSAALSPPAARIEANAQEQTPRAKLGALILRLSARGGRRHG